jgi:hypothetical protein
MCHKFFFEHGRRSITKDEDVEWLQKIHGYKWTGPLIDLHGLIFQDYLWQHETKTVFLIS